MVPAGGFGGACGVRDVGPSPLEARRARAIDGARAALAMLRGLGVTARVTGSLARGGFGLHSDVDLLVTACPRELKYAIEGAVEDALEGLPFDVIYLDECRPWRAERFLDGAVDASELR